MSGLWSEIRAILEKPGRVFILSVGLAALLVLYDGSLFRYQSLKKAEGEASERISQIRAATKVLEEKVAQTRSSEFINKQAREQLDMVGEDEMVFVFSNDSRDLNQEAP